MTLARGKGTLFGMCSDVRLPFLKMQGLGNDFVVFDDLGGDLTNHSLLETPVTPELARAACDRRFGIGADQILWIRRPHASEADARMEILNADGSIAEMCGNGIRAVGLLLFRRSGGRHDFTIETLAGLKRVTVDPAGLSVRVSMGVPTIDTAVVNDGGELLELADGSQARIFAVDVGNPHAVLFVSDVEALAVEKIGPVIENHPRFPKRTNVEFVEVRGPDLIRMRVWERGAGVTLACGTGACASVVAARATGRVAANEVQVILDGGALRVGWMGEGSPVFLEGPAGEAFRGTWGCAP